MLIISRRPQQSIHITTKSGEEIIIDITKIRGNTVRLGFTCDKAIDITRPEKKEDYKWGKKDT